jgi:ankyrin repeat protein
VQSLVAVGADVQAKRDDGWTPLYTAAYNGDLPVVHLLCKKGADVNVANMVRPNTGKF